MDPDVPVPSIESDDLLPRLLAQAKETQYHPPRTIDLVSIDPAAATPLPPSSPPNSPWKTPRPEKQKFSQPRHVSPSLGSSRNSPVDVPPRSPTLNKKTSASLLNRTNGNTPTKPQFRRTSSNLNPSSPSMNMAMKPFPLPTESKPPITPGSVAREYFEKELKHQEDSPDTRTTIFIHDSCYGHRFSRPKVSKVGLSTIVERPERLHATILGVSTAYVQLGERHSGGRYGPHPRRDVVSSSPPPFKIRKTSRSLPLNHPSVTHVHGTKWMEELQVLCDSAEGKLALNGKELVRPIGYGKDENGNPLPKLHEGDLYLCAESLVALQGCLGGVCDAVDNVFSSPTTKRAFVCIRPPGHHCSSNFPSGFCWLNNVHVGIAYAAMNHELTHAAIIDFDLHHGDGSQSITWEHNKRALGLPKNAAAYKKTPIGYFSLHDINSYPCEMGDEEKVRSASMCIENAHGQSIWNVHLEPWRNLNDFWTLYETRYTILLEKTRRFLRNHTQRFATLPTGQKPKAAIFLSAGFDASEWESAGMQRHKVNVPTDFYAKFTADVIKLSEEEGLGVDGRVISVLEGGYSDRALTSGVLSHVCGLAVQHNSTNGLGLGYQMELEQSSSSYNAKWWAKEQLESIEARVHSEDSPSTTKKKDNSPGNYTSPTQASTAKMTDVARERRSLSAQFGSRMSLEPEPELPPPEVDWATAAYELSRLIIPSDRQTLSCRHDELNAEATRARRERQSTIGLPEIPAEPMQLRDRRAKPLPFEPNHMRTSSRSDKRRTTIAAVADLPDPDFRSASGETTAASSRPRRRSSGASSILSGFQSMQLDDDKEGKENQLSRASSVTTQKVNKPSILKKTRVTTGVKAPAKTRSSPKKAAGSAPPVPRVPSLFTRPSDGEEMVTNRPSSSETRSYGAAPVVKAEDLDGLSTGMKKMSIKLKVRSPEEAATQANGEEKKKVRAPRKPAVSKAPKVAKAALTTSAADIQKPLALPQDVGASSQAATVSQPFEMPQVTLPSFAKQQEVDSQPSSVIDETILPPVAQIAVLPEPTLTYENGSAAPPMSKVIDIAEAIPDNNQTAARTEDASAALESPLSEPSALNVENMNGNYTMRPPAVSAPSSLMKKTKADLPVFTSSSPIPFASTRIDEAENGKLDGSGIENANAVEGLNGPVKREAEEKERSIWDLPETPRK